MKLSLGVSEEWRGNFPRRVHALRPDTVRRHLGLIRHRRHLGCSGDKTLRPYNILNGTRASLRKRPLRPKRLTITRSARPDRWCWRPERQRPVTARHQACNPSRKPRGSGTAAVPHRYEPAWRIASARRSNDGRAEQVLKGAISLRIQIRRELGQDLVPVLVLFIDECRPIALGVQHEAPPASVCNIQQE
jgi:hypothetical protein